MSFEDYKLNKIIGYGAFGKILLATNKKDNKVYALKLLSKNRVSRMNMLDHALNEYNISSAVKHPNIVKFKEFFQTEGMLCYVMELNSGGTINQNLKKRNFSEKETQFLAAQLVLALDYLHSKDIIYRDLKSDNVMFDSKGNVKLIDFGLSKKSKDGSKTFCGTADYLSPEVISGVQYGTEADWWALGVVVHKLLTGKKPFTGEKYEMFENIKKGKLSLDDKLPRAARKFIKALCTPNKDQRLTKVAEIKKNAFFEGIDWEALASGKVASPFDPKAPEPKVDGLELTKEEKKDAIDEKFTDSIDYYQLTKNAHPFKKFVSKKLD